MPKKQNLVGRRFGKLTVLRELDRTRNLKYRWVCRCDCGRETIAIGGDLCSGRHFTCGCIKGVNLRKHAATINGKWTREYRAWHAMKQRCFNKNDSNFKHYGGRGIKVCKRWRQSFLAFLKDMGTCPDGMTLGRKDNNGPYSPDNCRWETLIEQQRNKRTNRLICINGTTRSMVEWSEITGINYDCLKARLYNGWSNERLLSPSR